MEENQKPSIRITREDILKLGSIANISISEDEIIPLTEKLQAVLSYASYLKEVAQKLEGASLPKQTNVVRDDVVIPTPAEPLLERAPVREENFFVVPVIIKQ